MSDFASPDVLGDAVRSPSQGLNPEVIDEILERFRRWLQELPAEPPGPTVVSPPPDLHTLLGQMTGLRHDVNLQTRAVRNQQEQNTATLEQLGRALDLLEQHHNANLQQQASAGTEYQRPLLKTLIDIYDALALALREVQKMEDSLAEAIQQLADIPPPPPDSGVSLEELEQLPEPPADISPPTLPWSARMFGGEKALLSALHQRAERERAWRMEQLTLLRRRATEQQQAISQRRQEQEALAEERRALAEQATARIRQMLHGLLTGYTMSMQRIDRALQQHGVEPFRTVGEAFDPEVMEVVEVVNEPGRTSSEVTGELRRGYLWNGRVFRFAQVQVARPG